MFLGRYVCRQPVQQALNQTNDFIWISDNTLSETLRRFTHSRPCLRRASSVPGPLEARRRSTKRRMTSQTLSIGPPSIEPGMFHGLGAPITSKDLLWKPPSKGAETVTEDGNAPRK